jgi:hypothetical protein
VPIFNFGFNACHSSDTPNVELTRRANNRAMIKLSIKSPLVPLASNELLCPSIGYRAVAIERKCQQPHKGNIYSSFGHWLECPFGCGCDRRRGEQRMTTDHMRTRNFAFSIHDHGDKDLPLTTTITWERGSDAVN